MVAKMTVKTGQNWKKLHKSLQTDGGQVSRSARRKTPSVGSGITTASKSSSFRKHTADAKNGKAGESKDSNAQPWFADDMSEKDLSILKQTQTEKDGLTSLTAETSANGLGSNTTLADETQILSEGKGELGRYVAIDCEMVGVGPNGSESALARVSIVNWHGAKVLDTFVKAQERVTDYRTWISGVRPKDLKDAPTFAQVQKQVADLIKDRILVGHAIHNDMNALLLSHPRHLTRDTATYAGARAVANTKFPSLRKLVQLRLGVEIQKKGTSHSSLEDARATMAVYRTFHEEWQQSLNSTVHRQKKKKTVSSAQSPSKTQIIGQGWKGGGRGKADALQSAKETKSNARFSTGGSTRSSTKDAEWWQTL